MLYSETRRLAFIHIHKTGGLSLRAALVGSIPDLREIPELPETHHTLTEFFSVLSARGVDPASTRVVSAICHPAAHAVSIYEFWRSKKTDHERHLAHVELTRRLSFPDFLDQVLVRDQFAEALLVNDELPANVTILRRESLALDTSKFLSDVMERPIRAKVKHVNRTKHAPVRSYYDAATIERLRRSYEWTFATGFYQPEGF